MQQMVHHGPWSIEHPEGAHVSLVGRILERRCRRRKEVENVLEGMYVWDRARSRGLLATQIHRLVSETRVDGGVVSNTREKVFSEPLDTSVFNSITVTFWVAEIRYTLSTG